MTTSLPSAVKAAADVNDAIVRAVNELAPLYDLEGQSSHVAVIIQKHVEPIVRAVEAELTKERGTCMGTLCAMCAKKPADSHDGCRLRAAEALRESLESAERRAIGAAEHEKHWRKIAESEVERLKRKELTMSNELVAYEKESLGQSLAKELAKVMEDRDQALAKIAEVENERDKLREHHSFYESIQRSQQSHQSLCWRVANAAIKSRVVYNFGACGGGEPSFGAIVSKIEEAVANCDKVATERDSALTRADSAEALLSCIENGTDVCRPEVELDGILVTRELMARIASHLANRGTLTALGNMKAQMPSEYAQVIQDKFWELTGPSDSIPARGVTVTEEMVERALTSGPIPNYCNFGHLLKRAGIANGQDWMRAALEAAIGGGDK